MKIFQKLWPLIGLAILLFLNSCVTLEKCNAKFPPQAITKDSIITKTTVSYRDTTLHIKGEQIAIHDTIPCPELNYSKSIKKKHLTASVVIKKGVITVDCAEDSLLKVNATLKETLSEIISNHSQVTIQEVFKTKWYDLACRWIALICIGISGVYLFFKLK